MPDFDIFNGDADGLCALHQLRLAEPREAQLITGVKRDIALVARAVSAAVAGDGVADGTADGTGDGTDVAGRAGAGTGAGDRVTVLDLSFAKNRPAVEALLERGARVDYYDHHHAGELPHHPRLTAHIDPDPHVCTARIVDRKLGGRYRRWAMVALYGDNLTEAADALTADAGLTRAQAHRLRELGRLLNYNGYGETVADLRFPPATLYRRMAAWEDPFAFIDGDDAFATLRHGYRDDTARTGELKPAAAFDGGAVFVLPATDWARRVSGDFGNRLARESPDRACAVVTTNRDGTHRLSVRAPLARPTGADALCQRFATGGGRAAAAGINALPVAELETFIAAFRDAFAG